MPLEHGASAYLSGSAAQADRQRERERLKWATHKLEEAANPPVEEEKPDEPVPTQ